MNARVSSNVKCSRAKEHMAQRIKSGEFAFGSRFPGLNDLCKEYSLSYVTICKAVKLLEIEGYLRCKTGVGYFVCYVADDSGCAEKRINIVSTPGYFEKHREAFENGIALFEKKLWQVNLMLSGDLYSLTPQINSPDAFSIITAFNVNWERFSATFSHVVKRAVVLGKLSGNPEITSIVADEVASVRSCMEHFGGMGLKKVALATIFPDSELESLRIAAWRSIIAGYGLSFDWAARHLFTLNRGKAEYDQNLQYILLKRFLKENLHDTEALILPSSAQIFIDAISENSIRIPEDLAVISISGNRQFILDNPGAMYLDNNFAGHFQQALEVLENRFISGSTVPGAWYFCPPGKIISTDN